MYKIAPHKVVVIFLFCTHLMPSFVHAYDFAVMPVRSKDQTQQAYDPLMKYLSQASGQPVKLKAYNNFVNYWQDMREKKFDFALDAAHFVDYRAIQQEHQVLAKIQDQVSFSLVTTENEAILEASELAGKPVACLPPPSRGNLELDTFFKHPLRQPYKVEVKSYELAIAMMMVGKVKAAIIPTPMLNAYPELMVVESTNLWPHMGLTASNNVPTEVKSAVAKALLSISDNKQGSEALTVLGFAGFQPADQSMYRGYSKALKSYRYYGL